MLEKCMGKVGDSFQNDDKVVTTLDYVEIRMSRQ